MTDEQTQVGERSEFATDRRPYALGPYVEDKNHVPNPYHQYGTVNTTGTAGDDVHGNVSEVSPAFRIGRARALVTGARALDPEDPTPADTVVLPNANYRSEQTAREDLRAAARHHLEHPVELGMTEARRRAGLTADELAAEDQEAGVPGHGHPQPAQSAWVDTTQQQDAEQV